MNNWSVQVAGMALIGAATTAVFGAAEGFEAAWPVALIMTALIAVVHFGRRRSNVLEVMSGTGDERVRSLYTRGRVRRRGDGLAPARLVARDGGPGGLDRDAGHPLRRVRALLPCRRGLPRAPELRAGGGQPRPGCHQFERSTQ
jgi:hypothetical protein